MEALSGIDGGSLEVMMETPDFDWIARSFAFEDITYEHCSFFTGASLAFLMRKSGFCVTRFEKVFGGQYMWMEGRREEPFLDACGRYFKEERRMAKTWERHLAEGQCHGERFIVWGAGGKGVAFLSLLDPEREYVEAVVDINPKKQGMYLPGTGHPIISPEEAMRISSPLTIVVMNELYAEEIREKMTGMAGVRIETIR